MYSIARTSVYLMIMALGLGISQRSSAGERSISAGDPVEIGMPESLFQGIPDFLRQAGAAPFLKLMKEQTGMQGKINFLPNAMKLADDINSGKIQLGVFQGHEFAWAKEKYPDLMPIAVTVPMQPVQAFCVVSWNCKAKNIGDLKNEKISLPPIHRDYSEMFLAKQKHEYMKGETFSGHLTTGQATDAIQDVIDGKSGCAIVDAPTMKFFERVFPGQFRNIKILCQSEVFPNACIAVKKGELDEASIAKFRQALMNAPKQSVGQTMLTTWKLKGFSSVPDSYEAQLQVIRVAYPLPSTLRAAVDK